MRCEICGAPCDSTQTLCSLCVERRESAVGIIPPLGSGHPATGNPRQTLPLKGDSSGIENAGGIVLEGKYRLREEIGRGAMGTVFLADDLSLKRQVAVKFLLPELNNTEGCAERFQNEAIGMAAIRDQNVAQIFAFGTHGSSPYFVMEHLDGQTVEHLIDAHNCRGFFIPLDEVLDILIQSVGGMAAIHRAGSIHRDIKPANIMLSGNPLRAVIMDFGLVRNVKVDEEVRILAGTPAYIAPELVEGRPDADRSPLTDIYSMGATAFEIITGSLPFDGESWVEILRKHITEMPPYPSERRPGTPEVLDEIILKSINKSPDERYQSADEFLEDLLELQGMAQFDNARTISSPPPDFSTEAWRTAKRLRSTPAASRGRGSTPGGKRRTGGRGRLLVADSDSKFRTFVSQIANSVVPGCRIQSAVDGAMALKLVEDFGPTVMVIDLTLPEINGFEVIATLRGQEEYDEMEIIVVADRAGQKEVDILKGLNVKELITKPVDTNSLADILRPALERHIKPYRSTAPEEAF